MKHFLASILALLLAARAAWAAEVAAAPAAAKPDFSELETLANSELRRGNVPGCAVAVVVDGALVFAKGFGIANVDTGEPVKAEMLFRLGSTTKMFTAATLVSLVEEGKVKLDEPVGTYLTGLAPKIAAVTAHQLLTHSAGLADETHMEGPHDDSALGEAVRALPDSLVFDPPGKIYSYSNPGYWIAGFLAETVGGKRYADLVAERVLRPCGMVRSAFRPTEAMTWPLAVGHGPEGNAAPSVVRPLADNAAGSPAGQLFTSAPEFARFCIAFMNGGKLDGRQVLSPLAIEKLSTPYVSTGGGEGQFYGYGLRVRDEAGLRWLSHLGSRAGYGSTMKMCPEKKFAVIVLGNKTAAGLPRLADKAAEIALGLPPAPRAAAGPLAMSAEELNRLAGAYTNGRGRITLSVREGGLVGAQGGAFQKVGDNRYLLSMPAGMPVGEYVFTTGLDGTGAYLLREGRALKKE